MKSASSRPARPPGPFARFFFGRILPLIFILSGLAALAFGVTDLIRGKQSETWPQASGTILTSKIESRTGDKDAVYYEAQIAYAYTVDGTRFVAKKVSFGEYASNDESHASGIVKRYPEGKQVIVRYDPAEPSRAVLESGITPGAYIPVGLGSVFVCAGIAAAIFIPRSLRKQVEAAKKIASGELPPDCEISEGRALPDAHPKVTVEKSISGTTLTTGGNRIPGLIVLAVALGQIGIVTAVSSGGESASGILPLFLVFDTVFVLGAIFLLTAKYRVTFDDRSVGYRFGNRFVALKKTIPVTKPMVVTLEYKGTKVNNRDVPAIVVRNADGVTFDFGALIPADRKQFVAGHLAKLLKAEKRPPENPFKN